MSKQYDDFISQARLALSNSRYDSAISFSHQAMRVNSTAAEPYIICGKAHLIQKQFPNAESYFKKAIQRDSNTGERYFELATCFMGEKKLSEALESFGRALQLGCDDSITKQIYYIMGLLNQADHRNEDALLNYEKSESLSGANVNRRDILLKKIQIYVDNGDFENAEKCAVQLKLAFPREFNSYQLLFKILIQQGKLETAQSVINEANTYCSFDISNHIEIEFNRALVECFWAEQDTSQANQHFSDAANILQQLYKEKGLPKDVRAEIIVTLAEIYFKIQQLNMTEELCSKLIEIDDAELKEYIERSKYLLMEVYSSKRNYTKLKEYSEMMKNSSQASFKYAAYYYNASSQRHLAGKNGYLIKKAEQAYLLAIAFYKECMAASSGDYLARTFRAKCYADMGEYSKAQQLGLALPKESQVVLEEHIEQCRKNKSNLWRK